MLLRKIILSICLVAACSLAIVDAADARAIYSGSYSSYRPTTYTSTYTYVKPTTYRSYTHVYVSGGYSTYNYGCFNYNSQYNTRQYYKCPNSVGGAGAAIIVGLFFGCFCIIFCCAAANKSSNDDNYQSGTVVEEHVVVVEEGPPPEMAYPPGYDPGMAPPEFPPGFDPNMPPPDAPLDYMMAAPEEPEY